MAVVSSFLSFPPVSWWMRVAKEDSLLLDSAGNYVKMGHRNRYLISGANNPVLLTVPLASGRDQRAAMKDVRIYNEEKWQLRHWRTLESVYKRSPYFEHYEDSLKLLFDTPYEYLTDFNKAGIIWVKAQLKLPFIIQETDVYEKEYSGYTDLRHEKDIQVNTPRYHQVFEDRIGFQPDLSILDMLFSEGPQAADLLKGKGK